MSEEEIEQMREEGLPLGEEIPDDDFAVWGVDYDDEDEEDEEFPDEDVDEQGGFINA